MNPEIRQKWIEALRSGDYNQGSTRLRAGDKYCCLGVLCDLYSKETGKGHWKEANKEFGHLFILEEKMVLQVGLNQLLLDWVGITNDEQNRCIRYNDIDKLTFPQIADKLQEMGNK